MHAYHTLDLRTAPPQALFLSAVLRGIRAGISIGEPWLAVNGCVLLWNTYLSIMHQHRYAELLQALEPTVDLLLQLPEGAADGALVCGMAEAYAKALEHQLLLNMLVQEGGGGGAAGRDGTAAAASGGGQHRSFRFRETKGYEVLPVARVKTAHLDPKVCETAAISFCHRLTQSEELAIWATFNQLPFSPLLFVFPAAPPTHPAAAAVPPTGWQPPLPTPAPS
eukprot:363865-Chlamydomonas_euryale.AAC.27